MTPLLEFKNVSCSAAGLEPLDGFSCAVGAGENAVFFGVEGSGLRSITPLALCLAEEYDGDILYRGKTIRGLDYLGRLRFRNEIGYLHGDYGLLSNLSVEQNITLRMEYYSELLPEEIRERAERLMRELGIEERRSSRPVDLARSEILRTAYARAVAHDPALMIIEHAFADQSPLNTRSFMDVLVKRAADPSLSALFITYEPETFVDFADVFIMLYEGRIVFSGTRREFLESDNPFLVQYRGVSLAGPMTLK